MNSFVIKGDICYSADKNNLITKENAYVVCTDNRCKGVFDTLPDEHCDLPVFDYTDKLVIPGLVDLHTHAPQYSFRGLHMDLELLQWLESCAFVEEAKYSDTDYAKKAYSIFAQSLKNSVTTRACIFSTIHSDSTQILMDMMEESGLVTYVGKVNMDRNAPDTLCEESAQQSALDTELWVKNTINKYKNTYPIITPRFIPSCSDKLMELLSETKDNYHLCVQSHLSENPDEIRWVQELCPQSSSYGDAYDRFNMFGNSSKTVMAHCVYSSADEAELMKKNGVFVAHCPASNINLSSGIAPVRRYLDMGLKVGLGTDMAGGHSDSMFRAIADTIQVSKLYYRLIDKTAKPITFSEAFYLGTKGGGEFFSDTGSFEDGYEFDAVVIDDSHLPHPQKLSVSERLERSVYLSADTNGLVAKFVRGKKII